MQATGAKVRSHTVATPTALTPQEAQIARLAGKGLTNSEIGAELFISRHTVEWHLRKVFSKLSISSRREIRAVQGSPSRTWPGARVSIRDARKWARDDKARREAADGGSKAGVTPPTRTGQNA
ncbi:helix-turn-helix transcriptional regulator [Streptomyces sp. NPDC048281]|uniref:helix-turn-helix domain-containing protein n=1 Tax=Streptomyces sp. NPDC048281 TaxID=3154715 RepID=UPI0034192355